MKAQKRMKGTNAVKTSYIKSVDKTKTQTHPKNVGQSCVHTPNKILRFCPYYKYVTSRLKCLKNQTIIVLSYLQKLCF